MLHSKLGSFDKDNGGILLKFIRKLQFHRLHHCPYRESAVHLSVHIDYVTEKTVLPIVQGYEYCTVRSENGKEKQQEGIRREAMRSRKAVSHTMRANRIIRGIVIESVINLRSNLEKT